MRDNWVQIILFLKQPENKYVGCMAGWVLWMMLKWMWTFGCVLYADFTFYEERRQVTEETCSKGSKVKLYNCGKIILHILKWGYSQSPLVKELWATTLLDVDGHWLKCEGHVVVHTGRFTLSYRSSTLIYFLVALQWTIIIHVHPFNDDEKVLFFFFCFFLEIYLVLWIASTLTILM